MTSYLYFFKNQIIYFQLAHLGILEKSVTRNAVKRVLVVTMSMVCVVLGVSPVGRGSSVYRVLNIIRKHSVFIAVCLCHWFEILRQINPKSQ